MGKLLTLFLTAFLVPVAIGVLKPDSTGHEVPRQAQKEEKQPSIEGDRNGGAKVKVGGDVTEGPQIKIHNSPNSEAHIGDKITIYREPDRVTNNFHNHTENNIYSPIYNHTENYKVDQNISVSQAFGHPYTPGILLPK
jgi:hypothetical protein